ncbi:hypothetical protein [Streptacidiphilus melanogenes]|uniref:hypothetical protein n=1 Tax=Streptacidiphilus melanogenes TaxID=411235 RepID=UPI0005A6B9E3|nr:hypothetical protein [Streptacidiphilus melanogenes]
MITVVGHADLKPESLALVERKLRQAVDRLPEGPERGIGMVRAGAGTPLAFGRAMAGAGRTLIAVLPARDGMMTPLPRGDADAARELLRICLCARLQGFDPADRCSRITADEQLVAESDRVLAVWDGSSTDACDATAHLVAYARARGIPVEIVWPRGAARRRARPVAAAAAR